MKKRKYWESVDEGLEDIHANPDVIFCTEDDYYERRDNLAEKLERGYKLFSPMEKKVFRALQIFTTEKQIGSYLNISQQMVNKHKRKIREKLIRVGC